MAEKEYISREEAIEWLYDNSNLPIDSGTARAYWTRVVQIKDALIRHIKTIPAADVMEVVHGEDTGECRIFQCSICGYGVDDIYQADERNYPVGEFNFCPNCGAKIDGERKELE